MPRQNAGTSTLRNRNRITNKTQLKVYRGLNEVDTIVQDEEDDRVRGISTAGVNDEDANEHHLQAVLNADAHRTSPVVAPKSVPPTPTKSTAEAAKPKQAVARIPVPDATGVAANHVALYPEDKWRDPHQYTQSSLTVDESVAFGLGPDTTYYMDERDEEWLTKNNQAARGEGTSTLASVQSPSTTTRSSQRSTKSKGKDQDVQSPILLKEDEFELVMSLFEKWTQQKAEFLHHNFNANNIPPFSDYQDQFSLTLDNSVFEGFEAPEWVPEPDTLVRMARLVYPWWKTRRVEREGRRIIPFLNFDEADTVNEPYVCFRRREVKVLRKTRAAQATPSEKLNRLQNEMKNAFTLATHALTREEKKREQAKESQQVWLRRMNLVNLKRKFPSIMNKEEEELLMDKRPKTEKPHVHPFKVPPPRASGQGMSEYISPKSRLAYITANIERYMDEVKSKDRGWEDGIDNPYQQRPIPYTSKAFRWISTEDQSRSSSPDPEDKHRPKTPARAFRLRFGRGGRTFLDRRFVTRDTDSLGRANSADTDSDEERAWRRRDRWKYDEDDGPAHGYDGPEAEDRILIDDTDPKYQRYQSRYLQMEDYLSLSTDTSVAIPGPDGKVQIYKPASFAPNYFRGGGHPGFQRAHVPSVMHAGAQAAVASMRHPSTVNGVPISTQHQFKKMQPPPTPPQVRISSNPTASSRSPAGSPVTVAVNGQGSPTVTNGVPVVNGSTPVSNLSNVPPDQRPPTPAMNTRLPVNGTPTINGHASEPPASNQVPPPRPKSQTQVPMQYSTMGIPNGYMPNPYNGFQNGMPNPQLYMNHPLVQNGLTAQQQLSINKAIAAANNGMVPSNGQGYQLHPNLVAAAAAAAGNRPQMMYPGLPNGMNAANMNLQLGQQNLALKLPPGRPQWSGQRVQGMSANGVVPGMGGTVPVDLSGMNGLTNAQMAAVAAANGMGRAPSADSQHLSPHMHAARSASPANAMLNAAHGRISPAAMGGSPLLQAASPQLQHAHLSSPHHHGSPSLSPAQPHNPSMSPPHLSQTPIPSPQRPMVPGSGAGY